jgi:hypothetical protein
MSDSNNDQTEEISRLQIKGWDDREAAIGQRLLDAFETVPTDDATYEVLLFPSEGEFQFFGSILQASDSREAIARFHDELQDRGIRASPYTPGRRSNSSRSRSSCRIMFSNVSSEENKS